MTINLNGYTNHEVLEEVNIDGFTVKIVKNTYNTTCSGLLFNSKGDFYCETQRYWVDGRVIKNQDHAIKNAKSSAINTLRNHINLGMVK